MYNQSTANNSLDQIGRAAADAGLDQRNYATTESARQAEIPALTLQLDQDIEYLGQAVIKLRDKVAPVSCMEPEQDKTATGVPSRLTSIGNSLSEYSDRLQSITAEIHRIVDLIEL